MMFEHTAEELEIYLREGRCEADDPTAAPLQGPIHECGWPLRGWWWADEMYVAIKPSTPAKPPPPEPVDEELCRHCHAVPAAADHYCGSRGYV